MRALGAARLLAGLAVAGLAVAGLAVAGLALAAPRPRAPGLILVVVDTLRRDGLGGYGGHPEASPFLDELAAAGVVFEHHVASSSWTKTSYASLLTGLPPSAHGLFAPEAALSPEPPTLPERLPGVASAAMVANPLAGTRHGLTRGFGRVVEPDDPRALPDAEALVDAALAWLAERGDAPFLLVLMPFEPHAPYAPPPRWRAAFCPGCGPGTLDAPEREYRGEGPGPAAREALRALYDGEVRAVDEALARLHAGLAGLGLDDRTTWIVTADHGEALGEHAVYGHAFHLWDEVLRVPLVVTGPGLPRGARVAWPTSHLDLLPTALSLMGRPAPPGLPGQALLSGGRLVEPPAGRALTAEVQLYGIRRVTARDGRRKVVYHHPLDREVFDRYHADPGRFPSLALHAPRWQAFDLQADPGETRDLGEAAALADPLARVVLEGG